jgi:cytidylate kinase
MGRAIVIDGPAGSGKSSTAISLAKKLGFIYLDTGAMYRALTLKFLRLKCDDFSNSSLIKQILDDTILDLSPKSGGIKVMLDGVDVTSEIRSNEVDGFVSEVSVVPVIREYMQEQQRRFAKNYDIVAEGRDLGTYVFPDADVKIFLVADLDVRVRRRMMQKHAADNDYNTYRDNLSKRDTIDSSRDHSPLKQADDAIVVDTTHLSFEQQVQEIFEICQNQFKSQPSPK